jgi:hypothetical protein
MFRTIGAFIGGVIGAVASIFAIGATYTAVSAAVASPVVAVLLTVVAGLAILNILVAAGMFIVGMIGVILDCIFGTSEDVNTAYAY